MTHRHVTRRPVLYLFGALALTLVVSSAIAKEKSTDTGSREEGGQLGWSEPDRYVAPFGDALRQLKKGEFTLQPVQTQFGYHVLQLMDERPVPFPEFDVVKGEIRQGMLTKARDEYIDGLRAKAKIEKIGTVSAGEAEKK